VRRGAGTGRAGRALILVVAVDLGDLHDGASEAVIELAKLGDLCEGPRVSLHCRQRRARAREYGTYILILCMLLFEGRRREGEELEALVLVLFARR
jgi:hypothetical protein